MFRVVFGHWGSTSGPTETQRSSFQAASDAFAAVLGELRTLVETDLAGIEARLEASGAPWTPGRVPVWESE
jgi:hypothetical protein